MLLSLPPLLLLALAFPVLLLHNRTGHLPLPLHRTLRIWLPIGAVALSLLIWRSLFLEEITPSQTPMMNTRVTAAEWSLHRGLRWWNVIVCVGAVGVAGWRVWGALRAGG
jgi:hypothetical protein